MSIQSIKPFARSAPPKTADATSIPASKPFVRSETTGKTGKAAPATAKDAGPMQRWRGDVFRACQKLGLNPGEKTQISINGKSMVLQRTPYGDAYVFQTPEENATLPASSGLRLNEHLEMRYNSDVVGFNVFHQEAAPRFIELGQGLGVPRGGHDYDLDFTLHRPT